MKFSRFAKDQGGSIFSNRYVPGDWNAIDDRTGFRHKASELSRQWDGMRVIDPEERHPQDFLRVKPDRVRVPWARPDNTDPNASVTVVTASDVRSRDDAR